MRIIAGLKIDFNNHKPQIKLFLQPYNKIHFHNIMQMAYFVLIFNFRENSDCLANIDLFFQNNIDPDFNCMAEYSSGSVLF